VAFLAKIGGCQAKRFEVSEDGLQYTFYLREDAAYTAEGLGSELGLLLGFEE